MRLWTRLTRAVDSSLPLVISLHPKLRGVPAFVALAALPATRENARS